MAAQITKVRDGQWPTIRVLKVVPLSEYEFPDGTSPLDEDGELIEDLKKIADAQFDLEEYTAAKENSYYSETSDSPQSQRTTAGSGKHRPVEP